MGKDGGGGGGGGGSAAFLYGLIALIYIGLFAVRTNFVKKAFVLWLNGLWFAELNTDAPTYNQTSPNLRVYSM